MNDYQKTWWEQTCSDYDMLLLLRKNNAPPCQQLHYLQMVTEKLAKAYWWRDNRPPKSTHVAFVRFLQIVAGNLRREEQRRIADLLNLENEKKLRWHIREISDLAYEVERLAPGLVEDGPNAEYPWPHENPRHSPVKYQFPLWEKLASTGRGRQFLQFIDKAVRQFPKYA